MKKPPFRPRSRGFTTIELVVVLVIVGILAAVALPRLRGGSGFEERGLRDQIVAALRYAQKSAIAARRTVCADFATANQVAFRISGAYPAADCTAGSALLGPDGAQLGVKASGGVTFAASRAALVFDAMGRPDGALSVSVSTLPAALAVRVESETGYVY